MRRAREQKTGYVYRRGGFWVLRYRETINQDGELKTVHRAKQLDQIGPKFKTKASVKDLVEAELKELNQANKEPEKVVILVDFVERVFMPRVAQKRRPVRSRDIGTSGRITYGPEQRMCSCEK